MHGIGFFKIYYCICFNWNGAVAIWRNFRHQKCIGSCHIDNDVILTMTMTLHWRQNGSDSVSNHQPHDCLLNGLFGHRSKKTSKPRVTGLCVGNSPGTGEFPAQMASNAENVSIRWRNHGRFYDNRLVKRKQVFQNSDRTCERLVTFSLLFKIAIFLLFMSI